MNASILDLRYKSKTILKALEKREKVNILYHGKVKGVIFPSDPKQGAKVTEHPFFGMLKKQKTTVAQMMKKLRSPRYK